jgi:hypothetical protein
MHGSVLGCGLDGGSGELFQRRLTPDFGELVWWLRSLPGPVAVTCEAGPTGFGLARYLLAEGFECVVAAPSKLQRPRGDRVKTDVRDARHLARLLHLGEIVGVTVPSLEQEAARDLVRAREDVRGDLMAARHRVSKLLLCQGIVYCGGKPWTGMPGAPEESAGHHRSDAVEFGEPGAVLTEDPEQLGRDLLETGVELSDLGDDVAGQGLARDLDRTGWAHPDEHLGSKPTVAAERGVDLHAGQHPVRAVLERAGGVGALVGVDPDDDHVRVPLVRRARATVDDMPTSSAEAPDRPLLSQTMARNTGRHDQPRDSQPEGGRRFTSQNGRCSARDRRSTTSGTL